MSVRKAEKPLMSHRKPGSKEQDRKKVVGESVSPSSSAKLNQIQQYSDKQPGEKNTASPTAQLTQAYPSISKV